MHMVILVAYIYVVLVCNTLLMKQEWKLLKEEGERKKKKTARQTEIKTHDYYYLLINLLSTYSCYCR